MWTRGFVSQDMSLRRVQRQSWESLLSLIFNVFICREALDSHIQKPCLFGYFFMKAFYKNQKGSPVCCCFLVLLNGGILSSQIFFFFLFFAFLCGAELLLNLVFHGVFHVLQWTAPHHAHQHHQRSCTVHYKPKRKTTILSTKSPFFFFFGVGVSSLMTVDDRFTIVILRFAQWVSSRRAWQLSD